MIYSAITTTISIIVAYIIMLYYCDTTMEYKKNRIQSHLIATVGYIAYCVICLLRIPTLNIISFIIISFFIIYTGYKNNIRRIVLQVIMLTAFIMFAELIASLFTNIRIDNSTMTHITLVEYIIFSLTSKVIYFIFVIILKNITVDRQSEYYSAETLWFIILPVSTCVFFSIFNKLHNSLSTQAELLCIVLSIMLLASNIIVYVVCERIIEKNQKIHYLQEVRQKEEIDLKSYQLIKEKYDDLKIMVHDFNKYCNNIEALLNNEQSDILSLTQKLKNENKEFLLVEYTNNMALNVLLSQKMKECNKGNIDFQLYAKNIDLTFIDELDVISIFANLIDNAIESCRQSSARKIFFSINILNGSYIVFSVDNSADKEPIILNERLVSRKHNKEKHGIGMTSINKAISKYHGCMQWNYDKKSHIVSLLLLSK